MIWVAISALVAAFGLPVHGVVSTKCPRPDICFTINIPDATLASATGDIFFNITGPVTQLPISLTHVSSEDRETVILIYKWENDYTMSDWRMTENIVVSKDKSFGVHKFGWWKDHAIPFYEAELLDGSGVNDGMMTANIKCYGCDTKIGGSMDLTAPLASWTWDYMARTSHLWKFSFDTSSTEEPATDMFLRTQVKSREAPIAHAGSTGGPPLYVRRMAMVHGIFACLAWAFIFPLGGIMIRLCSFRRLLWAHALLQIFGLCVYTVAVGLGIELGISPRHWWIKDKHAIIGLTIYGLFLLQAASGYIHHLMFKKYISRTLWSHIHLWTGRVCITLGMINAGFGFHLRKQGYESWKVILYTACAVLVWIAYVSSAVIGEWRKKRQVEQAALEGESGASATNSDVLTPVMSETAKDG